MNGEVASRDFPQLCEGCLGTNPYVRMQRTPGGGTCKMCSKPFETFKWRPGRGESYRRTEVYIFTNHITQLLKPSSLQMTSFNFKHDKVCWTCARMKDICQACILDVQFGESFA